MKCISVFNRNVRQFVIGGGYKVLQGSGRNHECRSILEIDYEATGFGVVARCRGRWRRRGHLSTTLTSLVQIGV